MPVFARAMGKSCVCGFGLRLKGRFDLLHTHTHVHTDALDIRNDDHVVVYDHSDVYSAFRVWWTLRVFGHSGPVSVLDGGLAHWMAEGHETVVIAPSVSNSNSLESDANSLREATVEAPAYKSDWQSGRYRRFEDMVKNVRLRTWQVADARSEERYDGSCHVCVYSTMVLHSSSI